MNNNLAKPILINWTTQKISEYNSVAIFGIRGQSTILPLIYKFETDIVKEN